jgi:hypothetical protein
MITGSLAAVALNIDRITKRKSDIVLLLSERLPGVPILGVRACCAGLPAVTRFGFLTSGGSRLVTRRDSHFFWD